LTIFHISHYPPSTLSTSLSTTDSNDPPTLWFDLMPCSCTVAHYKWYALSKETRRGYRAAVRSHEKFCRDGMVDRPWYLSRLEVVQEWLGWMGAERATKHRLDHSTINKYMFALQSHHTNINLPYSGVVNPSTRSVINGIRNYHASRPSSTTTLSTNNNGPQQAAPITLPLLRHLVNIVHNNEDKLGKGYVVYLMGWMVKGWGDYVFWYFQQEEIGL
jgi:hypothetical protein